MGMKVETLDLEKYDRSVDILEKMRDHRRKKPTTKTEELYYDLMAKLLREVRDASDEGNRFITYAMSVPNEVFVAMGLVGLEYDMACGMITSLLRSHDDIYNSAFAIGTRPEICSAQRTPIGVFAKGWFPRPVAVVASNLDQCDNCAQTGNILGELYDVPTFFVNRPYRWWDERGVQLMAGELGDLVSFLEAQTSRRMDWDKLQETIKITLRMIELSQEIHKLAMATPCPMRGKAATFAHWLRWAYAGRPEVLTFFETFRDELKEMAARGKGVAPVERFRLMSLFTPPQNQLGLLDWLESEKGAVLISECYYLRYERVELVDPSKPLEALAWLYYIDPYYRFYGELDEYLDMILNDALESKPDGALNWFNSKCRMGGSVSKVVKDMLWEKAGIPTLTVDVDLLDPSKVLEQNLKDLIEKFLDILKQKGQD
jgi:benzoyl-CoA reductase/2-hydroxyglutaryl-CoA dehydratase subunit BcrC/BadD/HgdB